MTTDDGGTTDVVLLPLLMGGRRPGVRQPLARIGEHTDEVLAALHVAPPSARRVAEPIDANTHQGGPMSIRLRRPLLRALAAAIVALVPIAAFAQAPQSRTSR